VLCQIIYVETCCEINFLDMHKGSMVSSVTHDFAASEIVTLWQNVRSNLLSAKQCGNVCDSL